MLQTKLFSYHLGLLHARLVEVATGDLDDDEHIHHWEVPDLRQKLPAELRELLDTSWKVVRVPVNVREKVESKHFADLEHLARLGSVLENWVYAGISPKDSKRLEVYSLLDGGWYTAVIIRADDVSKPNILATFHRMEARKVRSRTRKGYLKER